MKKRKKMLIAIFAGCMFAVMMMLNVSTTINGSNFSIDGYVSLVKGFTGGAEKGECNTFCHYGEGCKQTTLTNTCSGDPCSNTFNCD